MINLAVLLLLIDLQVKLKIIFLSLSRNWETGKTWEKISENNPYLLAAIGDFNAKLRHWHCQDTSTFEKISVENVASLFGLFQVIKGTYTYSGHTHSLYIPIKLDCRFRNPPLTTSKLSPPPFIHPSCHPHRPLHPSCQHQEPTVHYIQAVIILQYIQSVTIKLFTQNLILKSIVPHLIFVRFATLKIQMMILSEKQLISSTCKKLFKVKMWMRKTYPLLKQF